jgi:hypothetical protein
MVATSLETLRDHYPHRSKAFMVSNDTAFASSLVIIIMLLRNTSVHHVINSTVLRLCVLISLFGLMAAYAAGMSIHLFMCLPLSFNGLHLLCPGLSLSRGASNG